MNITCTVYHDLCEFHLVRYWKMLFFPNLLCPPESLKCVSLMNILLNLMYQITVFCASCVNICLYIACSLQAFYNQLFLGLATLVHLLVTYSCMLSMSYIKSFHYVFEMSPFLKDDSGYVHFIFKYCESCIPVSLLCISTLFATLDAKYWLKESHLRSGLLPVPIPNAPLPEGTCMQVINYNLHVQHEMVAPSESFRVLTDN